MRSWFGARAERARLWAFVVSYVLSGASFGVMGLLLPAYAVSLRLADDQIGMMQAAVSLGYTATIFPAGFLIDRLGSRRPFIVSGFILAAAILAVSMLREPMQLILGLVGFGAIDAFVMASINAAFFGSLERMGSSKSGWQRGSLAIGSALIGPTAGGWVIRNQGFLAAFVLIAALTVIPSLFALLLTSARPRRRTSAGSSTPLHVQAKLLLLNRLLLTTSMLEGLGMATIGIFSTFIVVVALRNLGLSPQAAALLLTLEGAGYAAVLFFGGKLLRLSRPTLIVSSFSGIGAAFTVFGVASGFTALAAGSILLGLALGAQGLLNMYSLSNVRAGKGSVVGFFGLAMGSFGAMGPLVGGFIGKVWGVGSIFWSVLVMYSVLTLVAAIGAVRRASLPDRCAVEATGEEASVHRCCPSEVG